MKTPRLLWLALFLLFIPVITAATDLHAITVSEHDLAITLVPSAHQLRGESSMVVAAGGGRGALRLARSTVVTRVSLNGVPIPFTFRDGQLEFIVPPAAGGTGSRLAIHYECTFNDTLPERIVNSEETDFGISGVIAGQGTFLSEAAGWYPRPPRPVSRFTITVIAPSGTEAITAGRRTARTTAGGQSVSTWEIREPLPNIALSAGPYRIAERDADGIPVYTYLYPENEQLAERYLSASVKYLRDYGKLFGPYPFPKFAVVENFFPTGYGFPSYTLIGGSVLRLPFIVNTSLPHEIAHNWWGNGVLVDERGGNWCEGLVSYLADYFQETRDANAAGAGYRFRLLAEYASAVPPERDFPLRLFSSRVDAASRAVGYNKGAMVFHMVRTMIGDRAFYAALRRVLASRLFKEASWSDFAAAFSAESGREMAPFISQWVERPGGPRLAFSGVRKKRTKNGWRVSGVVEQNGPGYAFPLTVRVETATGHRDERIEVKGNRTPFAVSVAHPPKRVLLDPETDLFRLLDRREIPMSVARIKGSQSLRVVMAAGCRTDAATMRQLLASFGQANAVILREGEADTGSLTGHDLLYCGIPAGKEMLPKPPPGVSLSPGNFTVNHERYDRPGHALFLVLDATDDGDRAVAIFLPLSAEAARLSVPKITHYNKFGYLVFADGMNRTKGSFPPARGGGVVNF